MEISGHFPQVASGQTVLDKWCWQMSSDNKAIPSLGSVFSKLARRSETKSDSAPPSPVVGLRKAVSGESQPSPCTLVLHASGVGA